MASYPVNVVILIILFVVVIVIGAFVLSKGLVKHDVSYYLTNPDKKRFLRYLSCSYAMCAKGCNSPEVIDICLKEDVLGNCKLGCYDVCSKMAEEKGIPKETHMCGNEYALNFTFKSDVIYNSNYIVPGAWWWCSNSIQNDLMKFGNRKIWFDNLEGACYSVGNTIKLDNFDVDSGCGFDSLCNQWWGSCYGMLRGSGSCSKGSTSQMIGAAYVGTGHLWLDPALTSECKEFTLDGEGDKYYRNCKFESGLNIYIWAEPDTYTENPCWPGDCTKTIYCPELILCSSPSP